MIALLDGDDRAQLARALFAGLQHLGEPPSPALIAFAQRLATGTLPRPRTEPSPWLTRQQAADRIGVSPETIDRMRKRGLEDCIDGRTVRIHRDDLDRWLRTSSEDAA